MPADCLTTVTKCAFYYVYRNYIKNTLKFKNKTKNIYAHTHIPYYRNALNIKLNKPVNEWCKLCLLNVSLIIWKLKLKIKFKNKKKKRNKEINC